MFLLSFAVYAFLAGAWAAFVGYIVLSVLGVKTGRRQHPSPPVRSVVASREFVVPTAAFPLLIIPLRSAPLATARAADS